MLELVEIAEIRIMDKEVQALHRVIADLGHLHFHDLPHSVAIAMINSGIYLYTVSAVLGHRTPLSTKRYSHLATQTLAAAVVTIGKKVHSGG